MKTYPTLYKRTSKGQIQEWTIIASDGYYHTEEGIMGGKISVNKPHICYAKNEGKANATNSEQQAEIEAQAKWKKKLETGYAEDVMQIDNVAFTKPMKGFKYAEYQDEVVFPVSIQDKLNGIRCQAEKGACLSTGGKKFHTIPHIIEALAPIFAQYPDAFIDGEAFNFGLRQRLNRLAEIVNVTKLPKHLTPELLEESKNLAQFHVFDGFGFEGITGETPWEERHAAVAKLLKKFAPKYVFLLPYEKIASKEILAEKMAENFKAGGEGKMLRWGTCPRKEGKSKFMLKAKHFDDDEFEIVDIQDGNANWNGCAKTITLKLKKPSTRGDTTFDSNIKGDEAWLRELFQNKKKYIGEMATTEFQHYSEYLIPQLPYVLSIRNYE